MTLVNTETGEVSAETLEDLEEIIGQGLASFIAVGEALAKVRDSKLYLQHCPTFEAYCTERWGMKRAQAYRLIESAEVVEAMSPIGDTPLPANEAQARELGPLKGHPEKMAAAMAAATEAAEAEDRKPTAADVKAAVKEIADPSDAAERWAEREANDEELQRQLRLGATARILERLAKARAELDHVNPDDFTNDQLRYLTSLGADLPRLVGRIKSQRTQHLRPVN